MRCGADRRGIILSGHQGARYLRASSTMIIDKVLSSKLRNIAFICALLVVVQHSYAEGTFLQIFTTRTLTRLAVPFFFIMSGFLLYKDYSPTFGWWVAKIKSRVMTLVIPFFYMGDDLCIAKKRRISNM